MIRVVGGAFRGRRLRTVPGRATRPLLERVREAVFDVLAGGFQGEVAWDLFAGTGASGIEALSRGAALVVHVERAAAALRVLRANLEGLPEEARRRCVVVRADAWAPPTLPDPAAAETPPALVLMDPPYRAVEQDPGRVLAATARLVGRMAPGGGLVLHLPRGALAARDLEVLGQVDLRAWGTSEVAFVRRA